MVWINPDFATRKYCSQTIDTTVHLMATSYSTPLRHFFNYNKMKVYGIIIYKREGEIYYMKCILMNKNTEVLVAE